jgi:predicted nucleotidyltransferase
MTGVREQIERMAAKYGLQIVYAFGSRAKEALAAIEGRIDRFSRVPSDLDIGLKPERPLTAEEKVEIGIFFEDLFDLPRVDVVVIPEAPVALAEAIVSGEVLYARDPTYEAEYQLEILRMAADLLPYETERQNVVLGRADESILD